MSSAKKESSTSSSPSLTPDSTLEFAAEALTPSEPPEQPAAYVDAEISPAKPKAKPRKPKPAVEAHQPPPASAPVILRRQPPRLPSAFSRQQPWLKPQPEVVTESRSTTVIQPETEAAMNIKRIVEAILFAANKPMTIKQIQDVFPELEQPNTLDIQEAIEAISQDYLDRPIGLQKLASGYRFQVREGLGYWLSRIFDEKPPRYSRALLETLAIIAYRQPVTRGEIEDIRGVSVSSSIIQTLLEREWVRVIAHKEVPGRPALYGTTKQFLDYFNISSLAELPTLQELVDTNFSLDSQQPLVQENSERQQIISAEAQQSPPDPAESGQNPN
ncbi:SMC-Scp complex subunit ScpB [Methylomonas paludis]